MGKNSIDWDKVAPHYEDGALTLRELGAMYGVTHTAIRKQAVKRAWVRGEEAKKKRAAPVIPTKERPAPKAGFLYVIFVEADGKRLYKIGVSKVFENRMGCHQCSSPFEVRVACCYYSADMRSEERFLHSRYQSKHVRGEWYGLSQDDLSSIAQRSLME